MLIEMNMAGVGVSVEDLWTNSSPSAEYFNAQNVTLSKALSNYDYFGILFKSNYVQDSDTMIVIFPTTYSKESGSNIRCLREFGAFINTASCSRAVQKISDTQLNIGSADYCGSTTGYSNSAAIPLKIFGIKGLSI